MTKTNMKKILLLILLAALPASARAADLQRIGAAGGVSGQVRATAPGAAEARAIQSGSPLYLNDRVVTGAQARLQVMLLDETIFTMGPNSDVVMDEFVYDPSNDAGKVSVKIAKGAFRFVTGKVARQEPANMKVKLPVGTIGIRGTQFLVIQPGTMSNELDNHVPGLGAPAPLGTPSQTEDSPELTYAGTPPATVILLGPGTGNNANEAPGIITVDNGLGLLLIDQPGFGVNLTAGQPPVITDMSQLAGQLTSGLNALPTPQQGGGTGGGTGSSSGSGGFGGGTGSSGGFGGSGGGAPSQPRPLGSGPSAGDQAGQTTAAAGATLAGAYNLGNFTQALDQTSNQALLEVLGEPPATQVTIPDGISTWDNVRSAQTGLVNYSASGLCNIAGSAAGEYVANFNLEVDFGARTYGGGSSSISLVDLDSTVIFPNSFDALTGDAVITLSTDQSNIENPNFDNSKITFNNAGGVPAANATVDVNYDGVLGSGSTQLTALPGQPEQPQ